MRQRVWCAVESVFLLYFKRATVFTEAIVCVGGEVGALVFV